MKIWRAGILLAVSLVAAACMSNYPLGMDEAEWLALSPAQKLSAREKQAELDFKERARREAEREREKQREIRQAAERQAYVDTLYDRGSFGDLLRCTVKGAYVDFHPGWREVEPLTFTLARREQKLLTVQGGGKQRTIWSQFSEDGSTVTLCSSDPKESNSQLRKCGKLNGSFDDFRRGISGNMVAKDALKGSIECYFVRPNRHRRVWR